MNLERIRTLQERLRKAKDALGHGSDARGGPKLNSQGIPHLGRNGEPLPDTAPHSIYVGRKAAVMAETAARDFYPGKYYIHPVADYGDHDTIGVNSKKEVKAHIRDFKYHYPHIRVVKV
jgi:hypothetical protein